MPKYKVTQGFIKLGEGPDGVKGVGEVVELDQEKGDAIVESGCAVRVHEQKSEVQWQKSEVKEKK